MEKEMTQCQRKNVKELEVINLKGVVVVSPPGCNMMIIKHSYFDHFSPFGLTSHMENTGV